MSGDMKGERNTASAPLSPVVLASDLGLDALREVLGARGLTLAVVAPGERIPGSYWGDPEAGLIQSTLYLRADTPVHSMLHEASHYLCLDPARRNALHTDAGSSDAEEAAVCYLQCLLADEINGYSRERCFSDMDAWGYTFVLGSARAWFERDSADARDWLVDHHLMP